MTTVEGRVEADRPVPFSPSSPDLCPGCEAPLGGDFCSRCGERNPATRDLSLAGFLTEALRQLTDVDAGLRRTARILIARPGQLTYEYMRGARRAYLSPLQVFLLANVVFFFAESVSGARVLSTTLESHLSQQMYSGMASAMVADAQPEQRLAPDAYAAAFDATVEAYSRTLVIVMVPIFALAVAAVQSRKRVPFVHHLVFAFHFAAVLLLVFIAFGILLSGAYLIATVLDLDASMIAQRENQMSIYFVFATLGTYLTAAQMRAYGERRGVSIVKALALTVSVVVALAIYRMILFMAAFYST